VTRERKLGRDLRGLTVKKQKTGARGREQELGRQDAKRGFFSSSIGDGGPRNISLF